MDIEKYVGFRLETVTSLLDEKNIEYNLIEVWDTKKTKFGSDLRVIKIDNSERLNIYISYF